LVALDAYFKDSRQAAKFDRYLILSAVDDPQAFSRPYKQRPDFYRVFISRYILLNSGD
jgi:hypothetical protein